MNNFENLPNLVESILFGAGRPIRLSEIKSLMGSQNIDVDLPSIKIALNSLEERYADSSIEIKEVSSGFRMQIKESYGDCIFPLWNDTSSRLSKALMETISIIAYKQPITKSEVEYIRGVSSDYIIKTLLEKELITIKGRDQSIGKPLLYGTSQKFLEAFGIDSISDLPNLKDIDGITGS